MLSLLQHTSRQINIQRDKTDALKQQEANLRQELEAAQAQHAARRASMEEQKKKHFAVASEVQHQEAAISECQAVNAALKEAIKQAHTERKVTWSMLEQRQEEFVQSSSKLCAEMQALSAQAHSRGLAAAGGGGGVSALVDQLRQAAPAGVRARAAEAAARVAGTSRAHPDADQGVAAAVAAVE